MADQPQSQPQTPQTWQDAVSLLANLASEENGRALALQAVVQAIVRPESEGQSFDERLAEEFEHLYAGLLAVSTNPVTVRSFEATRGRVEAARQGLLVDWIGTDHRSLK